MPIMKFDNKIHDQINLKTKVIMAKIKFYIQETRLPGTYIISFIFLRRE